MFASQNTRRKLILVAVFALLLLATSVATTTAAEPKSEVESVTAVTPARSGGFYYTVQWGDTLSAIAQWYGTTVQDIMWANSQITNPNFIYYGQVIFIPTGGPTHPIEPPAPACRYHHYVSYGETLSGIGAWYGVSPWAIAQANGLYNLNFIYAGQYLCIP